MKIEMKSIKVKDLYENYKDDDIAGVYGYNGKLNIRPAFQREFVYKDKQRDEVIRTINKGFPLNIMYWMKLDDDHYELMDGQQRTISICRYLHGDYSIDERYFHNLTDSEKEKILSYELTIYICEGTDKEKLDWFKIINIAGEKLTDQELRNAVYAGPWLNAAKEYFSKPNCVAYKNDGDKYLKGTPIRQEYLEKVLEWIADRDGITLEDYMAKHQHDNHATDLKQYYESVLSWIRLIFPNYRKEMKGLEWGLLYNKYHNDSLDPNKLEEDIKKYMMDEDVTKKSGIYQYLLSHDERYLSLRAFPDSIKRAVYEAQKGQCPYCLKEGNDKTYDISEMHADHIVPWSKGGKTIIDNCQMLCRKHNENKGDSY